MARALQLQPPSPPTGLPPAESTIYQLWYFNNPISIGTITHNIKVPIPKTAGPYYPLPFDKMQFPLIEWIIPVVITDLARRNLIWIKAELLDQDLKYAAYATLAYMYQFPDDRITSGLILCIRPTDRQIQAAAAYGLGISIVPVILISNPT